MSNKVVRIRPQLDYKSSLNHKELTVKELFDLYIQYCKAKGEKAWKEKQRALRKDIIPVLGPYKANDVTLQDVAQIINDVFMDRNAGILSNRLLSYTRCLFKYGKNALGAVEVNPCTDLEPLSRSNRRTRSLNSKEIYLFWNNLEKTRMTPVVKLALKFMLCTLARGIEVRYLEWSEIDLQDKTWIIPEHKTKNGTEHLIPLNSYALEILSHVKTLTGHSKHVFGWHKSMNTKCFMGHEELAPIGKTALSHGLHKNFDCLEISQKFTPHDLRRTGATMLTSVGYSKDWVSKLLNHSPSDVTGQIYDSFDYYEEKRAGIKSIEFILGQILDSNSLDEVPSRKFLRKEFFSKGLVQKFLTETYKTEKDDLEINKNQIIKSPIIEYHCISPFIYKTNFNAPNIN
ncbi:MAG: tyrosine-type recombinase/integrase [Bacteroidota bacterium]